MSLPGFRITARRAALVAALAVAGCTSWSQPDRVDYKSAAKASDATPSLEVPPDLLVQRTDRRFAIPGSGQASAKELAQRTAKPATNSAVLPQAPGMHIERDGNERWLVVDRSPQELWPLLRDFWKDNGFVLASDHPEFGVMETDWAENRAKVPQDLIRRTIGRLFDSIYDTGMRDKFRLRVERSANGGSEIYITHQGMSEELVGQLKERSQWVSRPRDPGLEAEFVARLMAKLGATQEAAAEAASRYKTEGGKPPAPRVAVNGDTVTLRLTEPFDRAWRAVGLAIDRLNFTVEDRDRAKGIYFVRYIEREKEEGGFLKRIFSSSPTIKAQKYQFKIEGQGSGSVVTVQTDTGKPDAETARRILNLLDEQIR